MLVNHKNVVILQRSIHKKDNFKNYKEMKKVMFVLAVAGMFAFAACNNNAAPAEEENAEQQEVVEAPVEENATEEATDAEVNTEDVAAEETPAAE